MSCKRFLLNFAQVRFITKRRLGTKECVWYPTLCSHTFKPREIVVSSLWKHTPNITWTIFIGASLIEDDGKYICVKVCVYFTFSLLEYPHTKNILKANWNYWWFLNSRLSIQIGLFLAYFGTCSVYTVIIAVNLQHVSKKKINYLCCSS